VSFKYDFSGEELTMGIQKVMVVDDDESTRLDCWQLLVEAGFDVAEAANGDEAISVYSDFQPDIVFMDITTPPHGLPERLA